MLNISGKSLHQVLRHKKKKETVTHNKNSPY